MTCPLLVLGTIKQSVVYEETNKDEEMKRFAIFLLFATIPILGFSGILKKHIPDHLVVLTFDDATASQYSVVAPLLQKFGFGATFFICEFPPNFSDTSKYMNWRQIHELDRMGKQENHDGLFPGSP